MAEPFIIPSLETERLFLRAFTKHDLDPFADMVCGPGCNAKSNL